MIQRVHARNFKSLADVNVPIVRPTVLVGRNGAGKSAFVDVLRFVRDAVRDGLDKALTERQGIEAVRRWAPTRPYQIEIDLSLDDDVTYGLTLASSGGEGVVKREFLEGTDSAFSVRKGVFEVKSRRWLVDQDEPGTADLLLRRVGGMLRLRFMDMAFYGIYPNTLRKPQPPGEIRRLLDDGSNLAAVLQKLSPARLELIRSALNRSSCLFRTGNGGRTGFPGISRANT